VQFTRVMLLCLVAASMAACDDDPTPPHNVAKLRIVNAAAGTSSVEVLASSTTTPLVQSLGFRGVTQTCVEVPATGSQQLLTFREGGTTLTATTFNPLPGRKYSAFLTAAGTTRRAVVLPDTETAVADNNAIRLVNATSAPGDVYATQPGAAPGLSTLVAGNLGVLAMSNAEPAYYSRPITDTQVRLFDVGTTTNPRADIALTGLPASRTATVVFTDAGTPAGPTAFIVTPCD
jgi:hypothetical protein